MLTNLRDFQVKKTGGKACIPFNLRDDFGYGMAASLPYRALSICDQRHGIVADGALSHA